MKPAARDLEMYSGDHYAHRITIVDGSSPPDPFDLTGYTFLAQVREHREAVDVAATFTLQVEDDDPAAGVIVLSLTAVQTAALPREAVWDLEATVEGIRSTWLTGYVTTTKDVSRV